MSKLNLMVCPHDTAKDPEKWYLFAQYLSQQLKRDIHFEVSIDFNVFHERMARADIVFVNPRDCITLIEEEGFSSIARPQDRYDEVVFIANLDIENPALDLLAGEEVATVTSMLPTNIALHLLKKNSIQTGTLVPKDSWLSVMNSVYRGEVKFGFVYKDTYDDLTNLSRSLFNAFAVSKENLAFHSIGIGPNMAGSGSELEILLFNMDRSPRGREILGKLEMEKWLPVSPADIGAMKDVIAVYG